MILIRIVLFFRTFYGFRLFAGDGSRFTLYNKPQTLKEFGFPEGYNRLPKVTFCGIVDCFKWFFNRWNNGWAWNWWNDINSPEICKILKIIIEPTQSIFHIW